MDRELEIGSPAREDLLGALQHLIKILGNAAQFLQRVKEDHEPPVATLLSTLLEKDEFAVRLAEKSRRIGGYALTNLLPQAGLQLHLGGQLGTVVAHLNL